MNGDSNRKPALSTKCLQGPWDVVTVLPGIPLLVATADFNFAYRLLPYNLPGSGSKGWLFEICRFLSVMIIVLMAIHRKYPDSTSAKGYLLPTCSLSLRVYSARNQRVAWITTNDPDQSRVNPVLRPVIKLTKIHWVKTRILSIEYPVISGTYDIDNVQLANCYRWDR